MPYQTLNDKKFLDAAGLTYFSRKLNDYPTNTVLEAVIDGIQDALDEKVDISQVGAPGGVASLNQLANVPFSQLPIAVDTTANWNSDITYIPPEGKIIIYIDRGTITKNNSTQFVPGIKIGDGLAYLIDLPYVGDDQIASVLAVLQAHIQDSTAHVTTADRTRWDNKLNYSITGENLILNRL